FVSSRRRHTISKRDWSSDVCSSDLHLETTCDVLTVEASADQGETWVPLPGRLEAEHEEPVEVPDGQITGWGQRAVWDGAFPLSAVGAPLLGEVQIRLRLSTDRATRSLGAWVGQL